jgi:hypothetical protein
MKALQMQTVSQGNLSGQFNFSAAFNLRAES